MFGHLHCHTRASFSDSILKVENAVEKAAADSHAGIAITDHGVLLSPYNFLELAESKSLIPALGCEFYFVENAKEAVSKNDNTRYHLILLAKNRRGMDNLIKLINSSWQKNLYKGLRGLVDWNLLEKYPEGLLCMTGCYWNIVSRMYIEQGRQEARERFSRFYDIYGKDLYCELGRHGVEEEEKSNNILLSLSKEFNVKPVVTNDVHYLEEEDALPHSAYIRTRFKKTTNFSYSGSGFSFKTISEMKNLDFDEEYLENTLEVLEKCRADRDFFRTPVYKSRPKIDKKTLSGQIEKGEAAYLPEIHKVEYEEAKEVCRRTGVDLAYAHRIEGAYRSLKSDPKRVAVSSRGKLSEITPIMYCGFGRRVCQFSESALEKQGIYTDTLNAK